MRIIWAQVFFSFNSFMLPFGLLYTTAVSPALLFFQSRLYFYRATLVFLGVISPYLVIHLISYDLNYDYYFRSLILFLINYYAVVVMAVYCSRVDDWRCLYEKLLKLAAALLVIGIVVLPTNIADVFWRVGETVSAGVEGVTRYKALVYEPSYFATLMIPVVSYFFFTTLNFFEKKAFIYFLVSIVLLASSLSLGAFASFSFSMFVVVLMRFSSFLKISFFWFGVFLFIIIISFIFTAENHFAARVVNVISGDDNSGNARTHVSFLITEKILDYSGYWFGAGFGQVKMIMEEQFWLIWYDLTGATDVFVLPSSLPDIISHLGLLGGISKLLAELYIFYKFRMYQRIYSLFLWVYMFVYQFTGSYMTNQAEYIIWIIACVPIIRFIRLGDLKL